MGAQSSLQMMKTVMEYTTQQITVHPHLMEYPLIVQVVQIAKGTLTAME